jgi:ABC-type uncharacterized transport system permease subunit
MAIGLLALASSCWYLYSGQGWWKPIEMKDGHVPWRGVGIMTFHIIGLTMLMISCNYFGDFGDENA